jgi:hypothetical protein
MSLGVIRKDPQGTLRARCNTAPGHGCRFRERRLKVALVALAAAGVCRYVDVTMTQS